MKDVIRIVLVDPIEESRAALRRLLGGITSLWLSDVLTSYQEAAIAPTKSPPTSRSSSSTTTPTRPSS